MRQTFPAPALTLALALTAAAPLAQAQMAAPPLSPLGEQIEAAMRSDIRSADERARDAERKPRQTLEFLGLAPGQRVVELIPAGGYFTKILAQVLAENGELYVAIGTRTIAPLIKDVPALAKVKVAPDDAKMTPAPGQRGLFDVAPLSLGVKDADLVLTFRNYHNLAPAGRDNLNRAVFAALKPGGRYGILDHTRRHNEPDNGENWRRMDPVLVIKEVQAAGFVLEDFSGLHYTPDDELRFEVGRRSVAGNSDRFVLRFRKP
jgi:predicted methyltransferase